MALKRSVGPHLFLCTPWITMCAVSSCCTCLPWYAVLSQTQNKWANQARVEIPKTLVKITPTFWEALSLALTTENKDNTLPLCSFSLSVLKGDCHLHTSAGMAQGGQEQIESLYCTNVLFPLTSLTKITSTFWNNWIQSLSKAIWAQYIECSSNCTFIYLLSLGYHMT